ncbi:MAG: signal transduction histidine kinase, partial [Myxococcota bacterium]
RAAERIKNEFLSVISHELRTPLTSIRGSLGLLEAGVLGALPDEAQEIVGIARSNTERLVQLINDILDLEKLDAGRVELRLEDISVLDVVASAARDLEIVAAQAGARLVCAEIAADVRVRGDRDRLVQVLTNLVSNAIKYSPTGGTVELRVAAVADAVRVTVTDEGPGVPEAERERLFRKFAQGDSSDTRQKSGTGLGLAISKAIVEQHGGRIGLDPTGPGGACFWFELPNPIAACGVSSFEAILPDARYDVLLVEQQRLLARAMRIVLKSGGHRVRRVADLDRARYAVALTTPGLVLFDPCTEEGAGDFLNAVACAGSPPARVVPDHP